MANQLTGNIPPELGNLENLQRIGLVTNHLTGVIPPELGNLENLQYLYLHHNQLIGPIPVELMNLTCLLDNESDFCDNYLYTNNTSLRDFLNTKQRGGDWESCQNSLESIPTMNEQGLIVFLSFLIGSALWVMRRKRKWQESV